MKAVPLWTLHHREGSGWLPIADSLGLKVTRGILCGILGYRRVIVVLDYHRGSGLRADAWYKITYNRNHDSPWIKLSLQAKPADFGVEVLY